MPPFLPDEWGIILRQQLQLVLISSIERITFKSNFPTVIGTNKTNHAGTIFRFFLSFVTCLYIFHLQIHIFINTKSRIMCVSYIVSMSEADQCYAGRSTVSIFCFQKQACNMGRSYFLNSSSDVGLIWLKTKTLF